MRILTFIGLVAGLQLASCLSQQELNSIADNLDVRVKMTDNLLYDGKRHTMIITMTNKGTKPINMRQVQLFFHSFFMVEPDHLPSPEGYRSRTYDIHLHHVNGMLFKMEFMPRFDIILPNQSKEIRITIQDWAVSKTDVINNWYITSLGLNPVVLASTAVEDQSFVEDFVDPNQYKRYRNDQYSPVNPIERFDKIKGDDLGPKSTKYGVIPTPKEMALTSANTIKPDNSWIVSAGPSLINEATFLAEKLRLPQVDTPVATRAIILEIGNTGIDDPESYIIRSLDCADAISIKGQGPAGVFYGIQTLLSLLTDNGDLALRPLPGIVILDEPRYEYRGMHLDVARNFQPKESVMDLIDTMAQYKMNKLHLHLSDDEAWRLEIPSLPELTSVGGRRCHDIKEKMCLVPQLGSGPLPVVPGSGYYRREDYRDILRHAAKRHVEIIPEFQMPSHAHAAIKSMEERFRRKNDIDNLLTDLEDNSDYLSVQMFNDDAMNPCIESTYNFMRTVIRAIKEMHIGISPLQIFNLGGEAVPDGAWVNSTACRKAFPNVAPEDLPVYAKAYFMSRLAKMVIVDEGLRLAGYEDAFFLNGEPLPGGSDNLLVYPYQNVWEWGRANRAYKLANSGYPVVMSPVTHLSFDHPYEPDPNERGLYWASRFLDTYKVFTVRPDNLYDNIDVKRSGEPLTRLDVCGVDDVNCDPLLRPENVKGIQAFGWTELMKDRPTLEYMLFPRMLALAERAWHRGDWENGTGEPLRDWERFANKLGYKELPRLDKASINYRLPLPGVAISTDPNRHFTVTLKTAFPNLRMQYSTGNGLTWTEYTYPITIRDVNQTIAVRSLSTDGKRASRQTSFNITDMMAK